MFYVKNIIIYINYIKYKKDQKISVPSLGTERETAIVPISEVITFKEFFKETFTEFRHKLWKILNEAKGKMISEGTGRHGSLRTNFRESSIDSQYGRQSISGSYETIDCIPISHLFESKSTPGISEQSRFEKTFRKLNLIWHIPCFL